MSSVNIKFKIIYLNYFWLRLANLLVKVVDQRIEKTSIVFLVFFSKDDRCKRSSTCHLFTALVTIITHKKTSRVCKINKKKIVISEIKSLFYNCCVIRSNSRHTFKIRDIWLRGDIQFTVSCKQSQSFVIGKAVGQTSHLLTDGICLAPHQTGYNGTRHFKVSLDAGPYSTYARHSPKFLGILWRGLEPGIKPTLTEARVYIYNMYIVLRWHEC